LNGHDVRVAADGAGALQLAREFSPTVTFLDLGLPGMNGYEVARRFRADPHLAGARLVALTGWGSEEDKRKSLAAGFDMHLTKPVDPADVEALLAQWQGGAAR
jgi:CheY-like chemotaxis protein